MDNKTSTERIVELRRSVPADGKLETGVWYNDFKAVKAIADREGKPFFGMWINPGCGFCKRFCENATSQEFLTWMAGSGMYFWLGSAEDPEGRTGPGWNYVLRQSKGFTPHYFPLIAVSQTVGGRLVHDFRSSGRVFADEKSGPEATQIILDRINKVMSEPPYELEPERKASDDQSGPQEAWNRIVKIVTPFVKLPAPVAAPAKVPGIRFRANTDAADRIRLISELEYNGGHCPCKPAKTPDTICLCREFRETGKCACGLFERY